MKKGSLEILYEDENVIFINKPAGMLSQKAKKEDVSLNEYLAGYLLDSGAMTKEDFRTFHSGGVQSFGPLIRAEL